MDIKVVFIKYNQVCCLKDTSYASVSSGDFFFLFLVFFSPFCQQCAALLAVAWCCPINTPEGAVTQFDVFLQRVYSISSCFLPREVHPWAASVSSVVVTGNIGMFSEVGGVGISVYKYLLFCCHQITQSQNLSYVICAHCLPAFSTNLLAWSVLTE